MARGMVIGEGVKIRQINLSRKICDCPVCSTPSKRHSLGHRWLREIGLSAPVVLEVTYSKHYCAKCQKHFNLPMDHLALPGSNFTNRVHRTAIDLVVKQCLTLERAKEAMLAKYHVLVPPTTIHDWVAVEVP